MTERVCVDASVALSLLLQDVLTDKVDALWQMWVDERVDLVAPPIFFAEVTSVLRQSVHRKQLTVEEGDALFEQFMLLGVRGVEPRDLQQAAWAIARRYNLPRTYDAQYVAVAQELDCDLWTGDQRLRNAVQSPRIKWMGLGPLQ